MTRITTSGGRPDRPRLTAVAVLVLAGLLAAPIYAVGAKKAPKKGQATLVNAAGERVGVVRLKEKGGAIQVEGQVGALPAGFHGFHVHAVGNCVGPAFTSAGGHLNTGGASHPSHAGDMPVLLVNADGTASSAFVTDRFGIADLLDADGSAIVVHASPDNYANIPIDRYDPDPDATTLATGDAGGRLACGVIRAR